MKVALMQPYLFPYLGYFDLVNHVDRWVVFDEAQYIRRGWVNRNRILHPQRGWQYIGVPVCKAPQTTPIRDIMIHNDVDWKRRMISQVEHYRKSAPFYGQVRKLLEQIFEPHFSRIVDLNVHSLQKTCEYIGMDFRSDLISDLPLTRSQIHDPPDWALELCAAIGADEYVNLPGGRELYPDSRFREQGLRLTFRDLPPMMYDCPGYDFVPHLSIIDVLMWNRPESVLDHLHRYANKDVPAGQEGVG